MNLQIAKATLDDTELVADILTQATQFKLQHHDNVWGSEPYTTAEVTPSIEQGITYLVRLGNKPVGSFQLLWQDDQAWGSQSTDAGYIHKLAVIAGFHGQGLGKQIIDWAIQEVARHDCHFLRLDCPASNTSLCKYYETVGFTHQGNRLIPYPDNPSYIAALYECHI